jgi:hypothetical protein
MIVGSYRANSCVCTRAWKTNNPTGIGGFKPGQSGWRGSRGRRLIVANLHPGRQQVFQRVRARSVRIGASTDQDVQVMVLSVDTCVADSEGIEPFMAC